MTEHRHFGTVALESLLHCGEVTFIEAPTAGKGATCQSCAHCPWMAMNGLHNLIETLEGAPGHEVHVDPAVGRRAKLPIERMLEFARTHLPTMKGSGDA